jgi:hypothetical protein
MLTSKFDQQEVIDAGHPPVAKGIVCVDFDGTIFPFGDMFGAGDPIEGAANAVRALKAEGYTIVIFSSRFSKAWHDHEGWSHADAMEEQTHYVVNALNAHGIPWDRLTAEKIPAMAYFDDKAYRAEGPNGLARAVSLFLFAENERVK